MSSLDGISFFFNPESALEIYCMEMLLHIYFCTHFPVLNVVETTTVEEKLLPRLWKKNYVHHSYFVSTPFATKSNAESGII